MGIVAGLLFLAFFSAFCHSTGFLCNDAYKEKLKSKKENSRISTKPATIGYAVASVLFAVAGVLNLCLGEAVGWLYLVLSIIFSLASSWLFCKSASEKAEGFSFAENKGRDAANSRLHDVKD